MNTIQKQPITLLILVMDVIRRNYFLQIIENNGFFFLLYFVNYIGIYNM